MLQFRDTASASHPFARFFDHRSSLSSIPKMTPPNNYGPIAFLSPTPLHCNSTPTRSSNNSFLTCPLVAKVTFTSAHTGPQGRPSRPILVIGAGIIGLTTAIRLHESNHNVTILTQETPSTILSPVNTNKTTYCSSGSGGLWMPVLLSDPRIPTFATNTYHTLVSHIPLNVGVDDLEGFLVSRSLRPLPWFAKLTNMERATPENDDRVPARYPHALRFRSPVVQMNRYLPYLESVLDKYGVPTVLTRSRTLPGEDAKWSMDRIVDFARDIHRETIIINCAGIGGGRLCDDVVTPARGVTLRVKRPKEIDYHISEDNEDGYHGEGHMAYAIPRGDEMTLGGTVFKNDWREDATEEEIAGVRERAEGLLPVSGLTEVARWTGLRPIREDGVRLGLFDGVVCNYGHGGSGVTTCWGCADEVVRIVQGLA